LAKYDFAEDQGRGQQRDKQHSMTAGFHRGTSSEAKTDARPEHQPQTAASPISRPLLISASRVPQFGTMMRSELPRVYLSLVQLRKDRRSTEAEPASAAGYLGGVPAAGLLRRHPGPGFALAMAISTSDIIAATSRRSWMASARLSEQPVEHSMRGEEIDHAGTSAGQYRAALEQHVGYRTCLHRYCPHPDQCALNNIWTSPF